jgi:hypothetical protein
MIINIYMINIDKKSVKKFWNNIRLKNSNLWNEFEIVKNKKNAEMFFFSKFIN